MNIRDYIRFMMESNPHLREQIKRAAYSAMYSQSNIYADDLTDNTIEMVKINGQYQMKGESK